MRYHTVSVLKDIYYFPLLFVHRVLNVILTGFEDSIHYSKQDVRKSPFLYSSLGWLFVYVVFCLLSVPTFVIIRSSLEDSDFWMMTVLVGCVFWAMLLLTFFELVWSFAKTLTRKIWRLLKSYIGLQSEPTVNEPSEICNL